MSAARTPTGRTSARWYAEGYQAAMRELAEIYNQAGGGAVGASMAMDYVDDQVGNTLVWSGR